MDRDDENMIDAGDGGGGGGQADQVPAPPPAPVPAPPPARRAALDIPRNFANRFRLAGRNPQPLRRVRRKRKMAGFSRRSFKFLRWLYHNRKRRRFTPMQQLNAGRRREVFFRAWAIARQAGRKYLTGQDVMAAQGSVVANRSLQQAAGMI